MENGTQEPLVPKIAVKNFSAFYGKTQALHNVDFTIYEPTASRH